MGFLEHLEELRWRLVRSFIAILIGAGVTRYISQEGLMLIYEDESEDKFFSTDTFFQFKFGFKSSYENNNWRLDYDLERKLLVKKATTLLNKGVLIRDVHRTDIKGELKVQKDVDIDINCIFEDKVSIGSNTTIGHNCYLNRCKIGKNVHIKPNTIIFGATIGDNCIVGPYARTVS